MCVVNFCSYLVHPFFSHVFCVLRTSRKSSVASFTEDIPSPHAKFCSNRLKITTLATIPTNVPKDEQQSIIRVLTLENVSGSEIHTRMCVVYVVHNVITISTVNRWVQRFKAGWTNTSDRPQSGRPKRRIQVSMI